MSENAILYLIHRIGFKGKMTGHGWRKVGSTWANEHEYNSDHVEVQLAHKDGGVRGVYNSAEYLKQRRVMLQPSRAGAPQPPHKPPTRRLFHVPTNDVAIDARKMPVSARRAQLSPLHTCPLYRGLLTQICAMAEGA